MILSRTSYQELLVDLSESEKDEKRKEILKLLEEKELVEFKLKQAKDSLGGDIKEKGNKITEIRKTIQSGKELKRVAVETVKDLQGMRFIVRRLDNKDILEERVLRSEEIPSLPEPPKQSELPLDASCAEPVFGPEDEPEFIEGKISELTAQRAQLVSQLTELEKGQPSSATQEGLRAFEKEIDELYRKLLEAQRRKDQAAKKEASAPPQEEPQKAAEGSKEAPAAQESSKEKEAPKQAASPSPEPFFPVDIPGFFSFLIDHYKSAARLSGEIDTRVKVNNLNNGEGMSLSPRTYQRYAKAERGPEVSFVELILKALPQDVISSYQEAQKQLAASTSPAKKAQ